MFCAIRYPRGSWYCCNPLSNYQLFDSPFPLLSFFSSSFFVLLCLYHFPSLVCYSYDIPHLSFVHSLSISVTIRLGMWQMKNPAMHDLSIRRQVGSHTYYRLNMRDWNGSRLENARHTYLPWRAWLDLFLWLLPSLLLAYFYGQYGIYKQVPIIFQPLQVMVSWKFGPILPRRASLAYLSPWFGKKSDYGPCSATNSKSIVNWRSESTLERYMFRNKPKSSLDEFHSVKFQ